MKVAQQMFQKLHHLRAADRARKKAEVEVPPRDAGIVRDCNLPKAQFRIHVDASFAYVEGGSSCHRARAQHHLGVHRAGKG